MMMMMVVCPTPSCGLGGQTKTKTGIWWQFFDKLSLENFVAGRRKGNWQKQNVQKLENPNRDEESDDYQGNVLNFEK